jgi:hypothetical protein
MGKRSSSDLGLSGKRDISSLNYCPPRRHGSSKRLWRLGRMECVIGSLRILTTIDRGSNKKHIGQTRPTARCIASPIPRDRPVVVHFVRDGGTSGRMISKRFRPSVGKRRKTRRAIRCRAVGLAFRFTTCVWIGAAAGEIQYVNLHVMLSVGVCSYCSSWVSLRKKRAAKNLLVGLAV